MNDALPAWTAAGYAQELVPVCGYQHHGCNSPGKVPHIPEWQSKAFEPSDFTPGMNFGQRTRYFPAIDIDVDDPEIVATVEDIARELLGTTARRSRSNSPRSALLYKLDGQTFKKASVNFTTPDGRPAKIEVLGDGQQLVVAGMHNSGVPLEWSTDTTLACISRDTRDEFLAAVSGALEAAGCTLSQTTVSATPPPVRASVPRQSDARLLQRASAYLAKIDPAISGARGSPRTLVAAEHMVLGFELSEEDAFDLLWNKYNPRCDPPWTEKEIWHKIREAATKGTAVRRGQHLELARAPSLKHSPPPHEPTEKEAETGFASSYVFVRVQNKYVCRATGYEISREALNSAHARDITEIGYNLPDGRGGTKRVTKAHQLVDHYADQADDLGWWPGKPELYEHQGRTLVNSFKAPPTPPLDRPAPRVWLEHLAFLIPQELERKHLLDVLAYNVQHPEGKVNHAVAIGGKVRTGKDLLLQPVRKWFNANGSAWRDAKTEELDGQFTEYLHRTKVLCVQESRDLSFETGFHRYNSFKTIIAAPPDELRIGVKFLRDFKVPNLVQVIILTNYPNGVYFEEKDDGRYFVTWSPVERRDDAYYTALAEWIEANYLDVIGHLARRDLQHFNPKALPPHTTSREKMHTATRSGAELTLAEVVSDVLEHSAVFTRQDLITRAKNMCHRGLESLLENRVRVGKVLDDLGCESREVRREGKDVRVYYKRGEVTAEQAGDLFRKKGMP